MDLDFSGRCGRQHVPHAAVQGSGPPDSAGSFGAARPARGDGGKSKRAGARLARGAEKVTGTRFRRLLDQLTRLRGVRGALLVAGEDGLIVAEAVMEGIKGNAIAALTGSLARRMRRAADAAGVG